MTWQAAILANKILGPERGPVPDRGWNERDLPEHAVGGPARHGSGHSRRRRVLALPYKESAMTDTPSPPVPGSTIRPPRPWEAPTQRTTSTAPGSSGFASAPRVGP